MISGAMEALLRFKICGIELALATNGSATGQREKSGRFDLPGHFDQVFIEGEMGIGKSDRQFYLRALAGLGTETKETWCIVDWLEQEVAAPQSLGISNVWVDPTGNELLSDLSVVSERIVGSIAELAL